MTPAACILGCAGVVLTSAEAAVFAEVQPWGFILFGRNVDSPDQVRALTASMREAVGRPGAPILIDQEGGRVQRLRSPHWPQYPASRLYGVLRGNDPLLGREIVRLGARLIAHDLAALGINVDCMPVLDVSVNDAHPVIGDRAYADRPEEVAVLGRAACEGLIAGGVLPVLKHIPGHGRATSDSHHELPVVETDRDDLEQSDFLPFRALSDMPMAMTAHVVFTAIDPRQPATTSRTVIRSIVREAIGFDGLLISDDISMGALSGDLGQRARRALWAGCDVVLHGNGVLAEMGAVAEAAGRLRGRSLRRAEAALARVARRPEPFDVETGRARFEVAFKGRWAA